MSLNKSKLGAWVLDQLEQQDQPRLFSAAFMEPVQKAIIAGKFPGRKDEEWRYTPLTTVQTLEPSRVEPGSIAPDMIKAAKLTMADSINLVFIDGVLSPDDSDSIEGHAGLRLIDLATADQPINEVESWLNTFTWRDDNIFAKLNLGLVKSAVLIQVEKQTEFERPLHVIHVHSQGDGTGFRVPLILLQLGSNSSLNVIESYYGKQHSDDIHLPLSFIELQTGARLQHYKVGMEGPGTQHISNSIAKVGDSAHFEQHQYLLGSGLTRSNSEASFTGSGSDIVLRGLYLGEGEQHLDIRTYVDHALPHCQSDQHFRGILSDQARGVFNGLVLVQPDAQHTDAQQSNKNLLLSKGARVDAKPQLEIFADDVKCAHGATVGQLDEAALFYLQSRGIGREDAELMLTRAFTAEVTADIKLDTFKRYLDNILSARLDNLQVEHA